MARKSRTASRSSSSNKSEADALVEAALAEIAALGWREVTLDGVAARAGVDIVSVRRHAPLKVYLLPLIVDAIDLEVFTKPVASDPQSSPRDRLFSVIMRRFDALQRRREAIKALVKGLSRDPAAAIVLLQRLERSGAATLVAADLSPDGWAGCARRIGLKAVMAASFRAWHDDDSADLAKTMAALDKALTWAERAASGLRRSRSSRPES